MQKKRINSCRKGKAGEREAAKYLCQLGFNAERSARNGVRGCHDLIVHDLPNVMIETKYGVQGLDIGTKMMDDVVARCRVDAGLAHGFGDHGDVYLEVPARPWAILWFAPRKCWRMTFLMPGDGSLVTVTGAATVASCLQRLNQTTP